MTRKQYEALVAELDAGESKRLARLKMLGEGAERRVYRLAVTGETTRALKIDRKFYFGENRERSAQMSEEIRCMRGTSSPLLPVLYRWGPADDDVLWMEVEILKPITAASFQRATGVTFLKFTDALRKLDLLQSYAVPPPSPSRDEKKTDDFWAAVVDLMQRCRLRAHEIAYHLNWGTSADGQVKVLDVGVRYDEEEHVRRFGNPREAILVRRLLR